MNNIDKFDILVGKILARLYSEFSRKTIIKATDFSVKNPVEDYLSNLDAKTIEQSSAKDLHFFDDTLNFLIYENMIVAKQNTIRIFYDTRLTSKGLKILKKIPNSINESASSLGEWLKSSAKILNDEALKKVTSIALGML